MTQEVLEKLTFLLKDKELSLATAESCTGGLISAAITELPGSSSIFDRSFVTYSNEAKQQMLGVSEKILFTHGAVSMECAQDMALGALSRSNADIAVSVTGIAGPDGGTEIKPVGLVYIGIAYRGRAQAYECHFGGDRRYVRLQTVKRAMEYLIEHIDIDEE